MQRPIYRKRKKMNDISQPDDEAESHDAVRRSSKPLRLGFVQDGAYVRWDSLPSLNLLSDPDHLHKTWIMNTPGEDRNIHFVDGQDEGDSRSLSECERRNSEESEDSVEDLSKSKYFAEMKKKMEEEKEFTKAILKKVKEDAKKWNKSKFKLISLESQPGKYCGLLRLLFIVADLPFDDEKLSHEEWEHFKGLTPYGTLPVVQRAGLTFGEPSAIIDVLSTSFGLMGVTNEEQLIVGAVYDRLRRLKNEHERSLSWLNEGIKDKSKIEWAQSQLTHVVLPPAIKEWEEQIRKTTGPFIVASGMTLADLAIMDFLDVCSHHILMDNLLSDNIAVYDLVNAVKSNPKINLSRTKQEREEQKNR